MDKTDRVQKRLDRVFLLELVLSLALLVLALFLFWIPSTREPFTPYWWTAPLLGGLFFGVLALHRWRKREQRREVLHEVVREVTEEGGRPPAPAPATDPASSARAPEIAVRPPADDETARRPPGT